MCDSARMIAYQKSWTQVKLAYAGGFMVSERGLQAVLYSALQANLPGIDIVVEPTWEMVGRGILRPDLVLVEGGEITDIFEIKFVPQGYVRWERRHRKTPQLRRKSQCTVSRQFGPADWTMGSPSAGPGGLLPPFCCGGERGG